jgi:orotidine 5'-phosphate decarboxylase subfamily 1
LAADYFLFPAASLPENLAVQNPIIVALDVASADKALTLAREVAPFVGAFKVGKELFVSAGPEFVRQLRATGASVFLDLKFHDIPNTVAKAVAAATRLDVQMLTIHTSGGSEMMRAAEKAAQDTARELGRPAPLVLGVTVLTSMDSAALGELGGDGLGADLRQQRADVGGDEVTERADQPDRQCGDGDVCFGQKRGAALQ